MVGTNLEVILLCLLMNREYVILNLDLLLGIGMYNT